ALCDSSVALDSGGAGVVDLVSGSGETGNRICACDDRLSATLLERPDGRSVRGGVHVDDRDAAQLGRELFGQRFLPPFPKEDRIGPALCAYLATGDRLSYAGLRCSDSISRFDRGGMETPISDRRWYRRRAPAALVLVADQCLERSLGDDFGICGFGHAANRIQ